MKSGTLQLALGPPRMPAVPAAPKPCHSIGPPYHLYPAGLELSKLSDDDRMSITLRAEYFFDDEANTWHYRMPALHINGGGAAIRQV